MFIIYNKYNKKTGHNNRKHTHSSYVYNINCCVILNAGIVTSKTLDYKHETCNVLLKNTDISLSCVSLKNNYESGKNI